MPKSNFELVREWAEVFGVTISDSPTLLDDDTQSIRLKLIEEEFDEYIQAVYKEQDVSNAAKELLDLLWVTYGTCLAHGFDADELFPALFKSNMTKLNDEGKPVYREDGKILKGKNYKAPDMEKLINGN